MKVGKQALVFLSVLFLLSTGLTQTSFQSYQNQTQGFSIDYPNSWQVLEEDSNYIIIKPPQSNDVAVEIYVSHEVEYDLEQSVAEILPEILGQFSGASEQYRIDATIAGVNSKIVTTKFLDDQKNEVTMQLVFIIKGKTGYLLFLESYTSKLATNQAILDHMLRSFSFIGAESVGPINPPRIPPVDPTKTQTPLATIQPQPSGKYGALIISETHEGVLIAANKEKKELAYHSFTLELPAGISELIIQVDGLGNDLDMAVKRGSEITTYDEDVCGCEFKDFSEDPNPKYTLSNPQAGILHIDIVSFREQMTPYTILVTSNGQANPLDNKPVNPLDIVLPADPFVGSFSGDGLTLELIKENGRYTGKLGFNGQIFPVNATAIGTSLSGSFESGGDNYDFSASLEGTKLSFQTGGASYILEKEKPKNPLGN